jgi:hypothetical protein
LLPIELPVRLPVRRTDTRNEPRKGCRPKDRDANAARVPNSTGKPGPEGMRPTAMRPTPVGDHLMENRAMQLGCGLVFGMFVLPFLLSLVLR